MLQTIYAPIGSDSFTIVLQEEFDDVKFEVKTPIYKDVQIENEDGTIETIQEIDGYQSEWKAPDYWREPTEVIIPDGCVIMSESRPDINYIVQDNGDGTGKWVVNEKYYSVINQSTITELINEASQKIATLQDAIDLDMAEEGDADKLKKWRKYRVLLSRVDTSVENMELPEKPD